MDTNTIAMIILFATFMIFMVLRVPVTFSMLCLPCLTALYLGPKYVSSVFCVWVIYTVILISFSNSVLYFCR